MNTNTTMKTNERFISSKELAYELGISMATVNRWMHEGRIPIRRIGPRTIRILREDVQDLLSKVAKN
jgi:excisionase family DNA binding protein